MSKYSSAKFKVFLVDGYSLLGAKPKGVTHKVTNIVQAATHGLGDDWEESSATGSRKADLSQAGAYFDDATAGMHDAFKAITNATRILVFALAGNTIGKLFVGLQGVYEGSYTVLAKMAGLALADAEHVVSGQVDRGVIVQDWVAKTVDWNTKTDGFSVDYTLDPENVATPITSNTLANPTIVTTPVPHKLTTGDVILISGVITSTPTINGQLAATVIDATHFSLPVNVTIAGTGGSFVRASTNNGGVGYQQVSDFTGFSGFVGKIRHSADDITYADLITFANVTAPPPDASAAQRLTVSGVVNRYLSFNGDVTGAGSIKPFVGFKRNAPQ